MILQLPPVIRLIRVIVHRSMISVVTKLRTLIARMGWRRASLYLLQRIIHWVPGCRLYLYHLVAQPVCVLSSSTKSSSIYQIRQVSREEYDCAWFPRPAQIIEARYDQGCICLVAFKQGIAVGCLWLCPGPYLEDEVRCCFIPIPASETAWDFDVYISPPFRLGRLFALLWQAANTWLEACGIRWTMSRIDGLNIDSLRAHQRLGAQSTGNAAFLLLGPIQMMFSSLAPYWHFSWNSAQIPHLTIEAPGIRSLAPLRHS